MPDSVLVPIDRATVRANPRAGCTVFLVAGRPSATEVRVRREIVFSPYMPLTQRWTRQVWVGSRGEVVDGVPRVADGMLAEEETIEYGAGLPPPDVYRGEAWRPSLQVSLNHQPIHHGPLPPFDFKLVPTPVTCSACGKTFPHAELAYDCLEDGDGETYSARVCPHCRAWDCCPPLRVETLSREELAAIAKENADAAA